MKTEERKQELKTIEKRFLLAGAAALAVSLAGAFFNPAEFYRAYLVSFVFWIGLPLGCLALRLLHNLTSGGWGDAIDRCTGAAVKSLPLFALAFLPVVFGMKDIFPWAGGTAAHGYGEILKQKAFYLNPGAFLIRAAIYFMVWIFLVFAAERPMKKLKLQFLSGTGLVLFGLTVTFAAVDWGMSLDPAWMSTMYGLVVIIGYGLTALAFSIVVSVLRAKRFGHPVAENKLHDLGNLLLAFVMLWAYVSFSQFLIIWSANLPEEISWYIARFRQNWSAVPAVLIFVHFFIPFILLLNRRMKREGSTLFKIAIWVFFVHYLDIFWLLAPAFYERPAETHWLQLTLPAAFGCFWGAWFSGFIEKRRQQTRS